jgi:predicted amidohydrolase YtcJ
VQSTAELVLIGGDIFTPQGHRRELAVVGGAIVRTEAVEAMIGAETRVIELAGRSVIVGLADAHGHLYGLGADLENVSVRNLASEAEAVAVVAEAAAKRPAGEWLLGRGWDQNRWPGQQFPTRKSLDARVADRPVLLRRVDGHAAWVNSRALALAGITKATKDPAGGKIVRDKRGEPTGVLVDNAIDLVAAKIPAVTDDARERRIRIAAKLATELGLTAVHEMGIDEGTVAVYRKLAAPGELPLHVHGYLANAATAEQLRTRRPEPETGRFVLAGVKMFADGALGSRGARLHAPYTDEPASHGLWLTEPAALAAAVDAAAAGGWQVAIHAIGDAGIGAVLDAYAAARAKAGPAAILRVEHVQVIAERDIPRMVATGAIASMQPTHATSDMPWAEARVGSDRIRGAYAWRTMLDRGIPLAFGSDFPVEEPDPLLGLHAAVTRTSPEGQPAGGWYPAHKISLDEAVHAFTAGAARAVGQTVGERADLTIFDGPLTADALLTRKVAMTLVDGEIVYDAKTLAIGKGRR